MYIARTLKCLLLLHPPDTATTNCDCINQCTVVSYFPDLSSSRLDNVDDFTVDPGVVNAFHTGTETVNRVDDIAVERIVSASTAVSDIMITFISLRSLINSRYFKLKCIRGLCGCELSYIAPSITEIS